MPPFADMRRRFREWTWRTALGCCCVVEKLDSWESLMSVDWDDKLLSPWASTQHGQEYGHLVSLKLMRNWKNRGDFLRALKEEDFLGPGSMLNTHPVLPVCLGFRNCELATGKDYSCYCRVRKILRGDNPNEQEGDGANLDCEPTLDGMSATYWVECIDPMLSTLYRLSSLRHQRSNFSLKKLMTNDAIMSDPIHMMYVHIEGMIPQFGPFLFEVWRRNQGLQMGPAGEALQHGLGIVITHPRRQALEAQLRQVFPNKPLRLKISTVRGSRARRQSSIIGMSSSCIFASTVVGELAESLRKKRPHIVTFVAESSSAANVNQSAQPFLKGRDAIIDGTHQENMATPQEVDTILPAVVVDTGPWSPQNGGIKMSIKKTLRSWCRKVERCVKTKTQKWRNKSLTS